jgi:hypothetical protein
VPLVGDPPWNMSQRPSETSNKPMLRALYPDSSEDELKQIEDRLDRYLMIVMVICERLSKERERAEPSQPDLPAPSASGGQLPTSPG